ncbi:hypothetical protein D9M73_162550 [compost metagenome]
MAAPRSVQALAAQPVAATQCHALLAMRSGEHSQPAVAQADRHYSSHRNQPLYDAGSALFEPLSSLAVSLLMVTSIDRDDKHHHLMVDHLIDQAITTATQFDLVAVG